MANELRRYPRVSLKAFAAVTAAGKADILREYNATCINISEGGCCLELGVVLSGADIDFGVKIGIELSDGQPRLVVNGRVVWLKEESGEKIIKYLIGIEFRDVSSQDAERIRRFVHSQLLNK